MGRQVGRVGGISRLDMYDYDIFQISTSKSLCSLNITYSSGSPYHAHRR